MALAEIRSSRTTTKTEKSRFTAQPGDGILPFFPCVLRPAVRTPEPIYGPNGHQEGDKCPVWTGN